MKNRTFTLIRRTVSILWSVILPICVNAQQIGVDEAQHIAAEFFAKGIQHSLKVRHVQMSVSDPVLAYTAKTQDVADFYVFNNSNLSSGFVIVAGNHEQPDILGYSLEGTFDMESAPENFKWWMEQYQQNGTTQRKVSKKFRQSVEPLIKTKWGQEKPFNNSIPHLEGYQPFVTGCTATAIAQVMNYYQYPKQGKGANSYSTTYNGNDALKVTFSADFGSTRYDWNNMLDDYSNGYTQAQADAVATLMYHVGVSEKTSYSDRNHGSSADLHNGAVAMMEHFDYDLSMETAEREHFTDNEWEDMIYRELEDGRPIIYSGKTSSNSGHAFIVHGYNAETGMFAINWGWNGDYDGYYSLASSTSLRPQSGTYYANDAYNYDHTIFIHIKPNEGGLPVPIISTRDKVLMAPMSSNTAISNYNLNRSQDEDVTLRLQFTPLNSGLCSAEFLYGMMFVNKTNGQIIYPENDNVESGSLGVNHYSYFSKKLSFNTSLLQYNGVYEVWPAYSVDNGETWKKMRTNLTNGVPTVTVTGGMILDKPTYTLTYLVDGEIYQTFEVYEGVALIAEPEPTKEGYTFSGWNGLPDTMPAEDVTVTGTFTVTYSDVASIEINGIYYRLYGNERAAEVIPGANKYEGDISIPNTVRLNDATYSVTSINMKAFEKCTALTSVSIPDGVTSIGIASFSGCTSLSSVNLPNSITEIGSSAFWGCKGLKSINLPNSLTTIGEFAFIDCSSLPQLNIPHSIITIGKNVFSGCNSLISVVIPGNITSISEYAFSGCDNLSSVIIEHGAKSIGERAFMSCPKLEEFNMPNTLEFIGVCAFAGCGLKKVDMPNSVITLSEGAFVQCDNLEEVKLSEGIKNIGTYVFQKCYNLKSVTIPGNIKALTEGMFAGCSNLMHVEMKEGVESIGLGSFFNCTNLQSITIPKSVNTIGNRAFEGCDNLTSVTVLASKPATLASSSFPNASKATLCVPKGSYSSYKSSAYWNSFAQIVEPYYTLTYRVNDEVYKRIDVDYSEAITPEEEPTKEGYTFSGWNDIPATMPAKDVIVTGSFVVNSYKLTYMVDGEEYKIVDVAYGTSITAEAAPTKEGYSFSGWSEMPATMPANDVAVIGSFTINKYTLAYVVDGENYVTYEVNYGTQIFPLPELTKEGYTFSGWSLIPETMPAEDVTITGTFNVNSYKLTYMVDGDEYKTVDVEYGAGITPEEEPIKEGYTFSGWSLIPETMPAHDVTITGTFTFVDAIESVIADDEYQIYTIDGKPVETLQKGVNIIKYKNGTSKKVVVK